LSVIVDYGRDPAPWLDFVKQIDALVQHLPDGAQRRTKFEQDMRFCSDPDEYLMTTPVLVAGVIVYRMEPGPKALAFRDALEGGAV